MWRLVFANIRRGITHPLQPVGSPKLLRWLPQATQLKVAHFLTRGGARTLPPKLLRWLPQATQLKVTHFLTWGGARTLPPNAPLYGPETYFAMVGCMLLLCPTLSVHANEGAHPALLQQTKLAQDDPERCEQFRGADSK